MNPTRFSVGMIALLFTIFGWTSHPARADTSEGESNVTITLNKRIWTDLLPEERPNSGQENPDFGGTPLSDVTFEVYDATSLYNEAQKSQTFQAKEWMKNWSEKSIAQIQEAGLKQPIRIATTGADGRVTFTLPQGKSTAYLFVEKSSRSSVYEQKEAIKSAPVMILLPYYVEGSDLPETTLSIYLKNSGTPIQPVEPEKPNPIPPSPKPPLPYTGEEKSFITLIGFGLLLVSTVEVWHKKRKNKESIL